MGGDIISVPGIGGNHFFLINVTCKVIMNKIGLN
jgi:hypothetical protein